MKQSFLYAVETLKIFSLSFAVCGRLGNFGNGWSLAIANVGAGVSGVFICNVGFPKIGDDIASLMRDKSLPYSGGTHVDDDRHSCLKSGSSRV